MQRRPRGGRCAFLCWLLASAAAGALLCNSWVVFRSLAVWAPTPPPTPRPTPRPPLATPQPTPDTQRRARDAELAALRDRVARLRAATPRPTPRTTPQPTPDTQAATLRAELATARARSARAGERATPQPPPATQTKLRAELAARTTVHSELAKLRTEVARLQRTRRARRPTNVTRLAGQPRFVETRRCATDMPATALTVLVAGLSRSGSTWQFNALRELVKAATGVEPSTAHADGDSALFDACLRTPPCLLKTHRFVPRLLPKVHVVVTSHRDLRDVLLSSMQMFGSCLGFGPEALHSRERRSSAAAHDVAPRFQQYAKWARVACYDMRYETMFENRSGEVRRLAEVLGLTAVSPAQAATVVANVEALKRRTNATWDNNSGFSADHVHEATSRPGAFARAETLVQVALQLPSCPVAAAFEFTDRGFGTWQVAHGYASHKGDAYTASLTSGRFPQLAHVFFDTRFNGAALALLKARDAARVHDDVHIALVDAVDDARKRFDYACKADRDLASLLTCAPSNADYVLLLAPGAALNASTYASLRDLVVDERRPLAKGWAFSLNEDVNAVLLPARWAPLLQPMAHLRGEHLAVLATAAAHLGRVVHATIVGLTSAEPVPASSKGRLEAAAAAMQGMGRLLQTPAFPRCCCGAGPAPAEASREWLWDSTKIELARCGLDHLPLFQARDASEVVHTWCVQAAVAIAANSSLKKRNRPVRVDEACTIVAHSVPATRACARAQVGAGEPLGAFAPEPPRRILVVRDAPLRHLESSDARTLRLVEWLCGRGHRVTVATRGRSQGYVRTRARPPAAAKLWFRRRLDLDACWVDVQTDDEGLTRVLAPQALAAAAYDLALLELSFDARFGDRPAAHVALERFRASRARPTFVALLSDAVHYRAELRAGAPSASAAAVYGYERLLYAHPAISAVVAGDAALVPSFRALQRRARPNASSYPQVVFASYRTDVDSPSLVGGADAHAHVASYARRRGVLVVLGPGRGHGAALAHLLARWRGRRLVVTGNDWSDVVALHCASERGARAASADDGGDASLADLAGARRAAPTPRPTRAACSVAYAPLPLVALEGPGPLRAATAELGRLMAAARVVVAPAGSTGCFLALEHGVPVAAPANATCGGLVVATGNGATPVTLYGESEASLAGALAYDEARWGVAARAALEVSLKLASSTDWLRDATLRGLLKGSTGDGACAALHPEPSPIDAALDASLLDALRSAVLLDTVM